MNALRWAPLNLLACSACCCAANARSASVWALGIVSGGFLQDENVSMNCTLISCSWRHQKSLSVSKYRALLFWKRGSKLTEAPSLSGLSGNVGPEMDSFAAPEVENEKVIWPVHEFVGTHPNVIQKNEGTSCSKRHLEKLSMDLTGTCAYMYLCMYLYTHTRLRFVSAATHQAQPAQPRHFQPSFSFIAQ